MKTDKLIGSLIAAAMVGIPAWTLTEVISVGKKVERIDARLSDHLDLKHTTQIYDQKLTALVSPQP